MAARKGGYWAALSAENLESQSVVQTVVSSELHWVVLRAESMVDSTDVLMVEKREPSRAVCWVDQMVSQRAEWLALTKAVHWAASWEQTMVATLVALKVEPKGSYLVVSKAASMVDHSARLWASMLA